MGDQCIQWRVDKSLPEDPVFLNDNRILLKIKFKFIQVSRDMSLFWQFYHYLDRGARGEIPSYSLRYKSTSLWESKHVLSGKFLNYCLKPFFKLVKMFYQNIPCFLGEYGGSVLEESKAGRKCIQIHTVCVLYTHPTSYTLPFTYLCN